MAGYPRTPDSLGSPVYLGTKPLEVNSPSDGPGWVRWSSSLSDHASNDSLDSAASLKGGFHPEKLDPLYVTAERAQAKAPDPPPRRGSLPASPSSRQNLQKFRAHSEISRHSVPDTFEPEQPLAFSHQTFNSEGTPFVSGEDYEHHTDSATRGSPHQVAGAIKRVSLTSGTIKKTTLSATKGRNKRVWLTFAAVFVSTFLAAVDLTIIAPILPTIAADMPPSNVSAVWIASASLTTSVSFQTFFRGLSVAVGCREALMFALIVFLVGSTVACLAHSMPMMLIGRGVQGLGVGGMGLVGQIIILDLTTPAECGYFLDVLSSAFGIAAVVAPVAGGWFATFDWRWAFYINFPLALLAILLLWPAQLSQPSLSLREKVQRVNIVESIVLFGSITALLIGLTIGGVHNRWTSASVLAPIVAGGAGLALFLILEIIPNPLVQNPILPAILLRDRTAAITFLLTFIHGVVLFGAPQGLVLYFEIRQATPLQTAIKTLPSTVPLLPAALLTSMIMAITGRYKGPIVACEALMALGLASYVFMDLETLTRDWTLNQVVAAIGLGGLHSLTLPIIQATLPAEEPADSIAALIFARSFGAIWGVSGVLVAFQVQTGQRLPQVPGAANVDITGRNVIEFVTRLHALPDSLREPLSEAYEKAVRVGFIALAPFALAGFVVSIFIKHVPHPSMNESRGALVTPSAVTLRSFTHASTLDDEKEIGSISRDTLATDSFHMTTFVSQSTLAKCPSWSEFPADYDFKSPNEVDGGDLTVYQECEPPASCSTLSLPTAARIKKTHGAVHQETSQLEEQYGLLKGEIERGNTASAARVSCDSVDKEC